jgi:hypothetical protein
MGYKVLDREAIEHIKRKEKKERQEKQVRKTLIVLTIVERLVERKLIKQQRANFIAACSSLAVRKVGNIISR